MNTCFEILRSQIRNKYCFKILPPDGGQLPCNSIIDFPWCQMQRNIAMSISQQLFQIPNKESLGVTQVGSSLRKINCEQSLAMWLKGISSIQKQSC